MIWYTSDTHFEHDNIIGFCNRPFENIDHMRRVLIDNWNRVVAPEDTVYHLGDYSFDNMTKWRRNNAKAAFRQLNGRKVLILGNHDDKHVKRLPWAEIKRRDVHDIAGARVTLVHNPMDARYCGYVMHGHLHTPGPMRLPHLDVGVDANQFTPVPQTRIEEIINRPAALRALLGNPKGATE